MAARKKTKVNARLQAKAREVLAYAEERAREAADWVELHHALFGLAGKATELFTTESERTAFSRTAECKRIFALLDTLPEPAVRDFGELVATANGAISVRLPRSVHAALLAEARAEGVSLNQLCLSKLVAQLRAVI
jgi:HicB family